MNVNLNNGRKIPQVGLGTWELTDSTILRNTIRNAIDLGYRHIDTAMVYENEKEIGNILTEIYKEEKIKRSDLFITSKL